MLLFILKLLLFAVEMVVISSSSSEQVVGIRIFCTLVSMRTSLLSFGGALSLNCIGLPLKELCISKIKS